MSHFFRRGLWFSRQLHTRQLTRKVPNLFLFAYCWRLQNRNWQRAMSWLLLTMRNQVAGRILLTFSSTSGQRTFFFSQTNGGIVFLVWTSFCSILEWPSDDSQETFCTWSGRLSCRVGGHYAVADPTQTRAHTMTLAFHLKTGREEKLWKHCIYSPALSLAALTI